jgi:hypothetical protein
MASVSVGCRARAGAVLAARVSLLAGMLLCPLEASAFVQEMTSWTDGKPVSWPNGCVLMAVGDPHTDLISWDQLTDAARSAAETWTQAASSCGGFRFEVEKAGGAVEARADGVNAIIFRTSGYCQSNGKSICDPLSMAITWLHYGNDGRLYEADIEINGEAYVWNDSATAMYDIQTGVTHEMGHVLGLDHNCYEGMGLPRPVDDQGVPIAVCEPASDVLRASIMYPIDSPSAARRALSADDIRGICALYPSGFDPTCRGGLTPDGGCCAVAPQNDSRSIIANCIVGLLLVIASIRRRSRSRN